MTDEQLLKLKNYWEIEWRMQDAEYKMREVFIYFLDKLKELPEDKRKDAADVFLSICRDGILGA